ncbi:VOC family protein [Leptospira idonii]|uniref:VOC family protein n=1 Tax=Leptospira idonii TaxID=1193500 RepID=A0A4R9LUP0_9LEPT|nr:VOC family protein [Leptospira idonii]TGN17655.1 VOC family protein [Leptospira idonii]
MKQLLIITAIILGMGMSNCKKEDKVSSETSNQKFVSIVEIPTTDFSRAIGFYQTVLGITIEKMDMEGVQMGVFPESGDAAYVVLVKGNDYVPTKNGAVIYLNAGNDLQPTLDKIEKNGGKIIVNKTEISPEMGFFALFLDTEGNKLGLHSRN